MQELCKSHTSVFGLRRAMEVKRTVLLYPGVGVGHLAPMLELARELIRHGSGAFDVAVALVEPPVISPGFHGAVERARASCPSVAFHVLPPPAAGTNDGEENYMAGTLRLLRAMNGPLRDFLLRSLSSSSPVQALVLDMFCGDALDVAAELGLPAYFFFPSGGTGLAVFLGIPGRRAALGDTRFGDLTGEDAVLSFPGAPPFTVSDLPAGVAEDGEAAKAIFRMGARMPEAKGVLVNTFASLEPRAVRALRDGLCVLNGAGSTPLVYCVGPLVSSGGGKEHECLRWLDAQPDRSVVFLCFGSMDALSTNQLEQIAVGLEKSEHKFLWVVRSNLFGEPAGDLDALLPAGFRERTKDRGLVVGSWAPQADVLRHRATAAFVTHCGWNSVLEGVAAGLPLLCWPLYAEQRLNKVWVVEEMKLGVEIKRTLTTGGEDVVSAAEVEAKVGWVMASEDEGAQALRERVVAARDGAADALAEGGSSRADLA
jgi:hypothetical protein